METYKGRLDSFAEVKRVKNPSFTSSTSIRWTHPTSFAATPKTLAEAGFYFNPSWADRDNVQCFNCGKELAGWTHNDDPFEIHFTKCRGACDWASVRCGLRYDVDEDGVYVFGDKKRLPTSKTMEKARLGTFKNWPHDSTKGHGASSKKMAQAGFVFTPQVADEEEEDTAACFYCGCTLSGWEPDDDPMHVLPNYYQFGVKEHEKRAFKTDTPCAFFASSASTSTAKPPSSAALEQKPKTKAKAKPKQSVRQSRAAKVPDSDLEQNAAEESEDELELPPLRKGRSASGSKVKSTPEPSAEPSKRRVTRGGSRAGSVADEEDSSGAKTRTTKARGKSKKKEDVIEELDEADITSAVKPKKGKAKKMPVAEESAIEDTAEESKPKKSGAKAKKAAKSTAPDPDAEPDVSAIASKPMPPATEPKQKLVRSKSKAPVLMVESSESEARSSEAKPSSKRKPASKAVSADHASTHPPTQPAESNALTPVAAEMNFPASSPEPTKMESVQEHQAAVLVQADVDDTLHRKHAMNVVEIPTTDDEGSIMSIEPTPELEASDGTPMPIAMDQDQDQGAMDETADTISPRSIKPPSTPPLPPHSLARTPPTVDACNHLEHKSHSTSPQPQAFLPPLAILPVSHILAFTEPEQDMTVEEWIRHEIALQYTQLKGDGERRIEAFRLRADAMRKRIDAL
ncbi:hypothetical protein HWV62_16990 [Athelia sp. TMB]|nr:hypothetical protein HWV62_16990 [Athelia sp. TMB]